MGAEENGTAKTEELGIGGLNYSVTKGAESRYIGEVWKAPEHNLLIVTIGLAIISSESLNEKTGIEPVTTAKLLTKSLKEKIEANAIELNYLPKVAKLPM